MTGNYSEDLINRIKESLNIVDVISDYLPLKKAGANYKGLCPFHSEKTPSFTVNEDKQIFHCFGCGAGGNIITFVMKADAMSFPAAVSELAKRSGIDLPINEQKAGAHVPDLQDTYMKLNHMAASFYQGCLNNSDVAKGYLENRGISSQTINDYKLGYGTNAWDSLTSYFSKNDVRLADAAEIGLILPRRGGGYFDRFRTRILFPISDVNNGVIGFGGRSLDNSEPKYLNSAESPVFRKSNSLYGISHAKKAIRDEGEVLIVEGYMDLLSLHQAGINNSVATLGTALTEGHLRLLKRFTKKMVTIFDADKAGMNATLRSLPLFLKEGISARVLSMPPGHDPDTYVKEIGVDEFKKCLHNSVPIMEFFIRSVIKGRNINDINEKLQVVQTVLPHLTSLTQKIEQWHYIKLLSELLGIKEDQIAEELDKKNKDTGIEAKYRIKSADSKKMPETMRAEKKLVQLMLVRPELKRRATAELLIDYFQNAELKQFAEMVTTAPDNADLLEHFKSEEDKKTYLSISTDGIETDDPEKEFEDCKKQLMGYSFKKEKEGLRKEMSLAQAQGNDSYLMELTERHNRLIRRHND